MKVLEALISFLPYNFLTALACAASGMLLSKALAGAQGRRSRLLWCMILSLCLVPPIAVGYFWCGFSYFLLRHEILNNVFYCALVFLKVLPIALIVYHFVPAEIGREGLHCMKLAGRTLHGGRLQYYLLLKSAAKPFAAAFLISFLAVFPEFEIASLLNVRQWTVALFDAHAGGLGAGDSIRLAFPALIIELALIAGFMLLYRNEKWLRDFEGGGDVPKSSSAGEAAAWLLAAAGVALIGILPYIMILAGGTPSLPGVFDGVWFAREFVSSLMFAVTASLLAYWVSGILSDALRRYGTTAPVFLAACVLMVPGLLGSLPLSFLAISFFQLPGINALYASPVPLLAATLLSLLPSAFFLRHAAAVIFPAESVHSAELICRSPSLRGNAAGILWRLKYRVRFVIFCIVFCWAYFDMTLSSALAPAGMATVFSRLYNLLHYGQSEKLAATIVAATLIPALMLAALMAASKFLLSLSRTHG